MSAGELTRMLVARGIRGVLIPPLRDHASAGTDIPLRLEEFACVTVGCRVTEPALHFAANDQFFTGQLAHQKLLELGYRRVGLVIPKYIEEIVECRFSAGFRNALEIHRERPLRDAVLRYDADGGAEALMRWFGRFKPDAVCTVFPEVADWLKGRSVRVPNDVAFATLDWGPTCPGWAGVDQESARVGAAAVDVIVQLLQRNDLGPPEHIFGLSIEGTWVHGSTAPPRH
jgi:DNA-binding LacI/PurR family transcriptional regulator